MILVLLAAMPMCVTAFWSVLLYLRWRESGSMDKCALLVFMLVSTVLYAGHCIYFCHLESVLPVADTLYVAANLLVFPLYLLYIETLTSLHRRSWLMLAPAVVLGSVVGTLYVIMDEVQTRQFVATFMYGRCADSLTSAARWNAVAHTVCYVVFACEAVMVGIVGSRYIRSYDLAVEQNYSDTDGKTMTHHRHLLVLFVTVVCVSLVCNAIGRHRFADSVLLLALPSLTFSVLLFCAGYVGDRQTFSVTDVVRELPPDSPDDMPKPTEEKLSKERIVAIMQDERLYLDPTLKLPDLARRLNTNRTYVSDVINRQMGMTFSEMVNRMRVDYAVAAMSVRTGATLAEIALESGFASTVSFYRNFKLYRGCAPSEWQQTQTRDE